MQQGHSKGIRPPSFLRVADRAAAVMQVVTRGVRLPPARAPLYRKWRAKGEQPSPVERVEQMLVELHSLGVSIATLRRVPQMLHDLLNDLSIGTARLALTTETLVTESALEADENQLALRIAAGDRSPATLTAYADACEAEAHHQLELARAARHEARTLHLRTA